VELPNFIDIDRRRQRKEKVQDRKVLAYKNLYYLTFSL